MIKDLTIKVSLDTAQAKSEAEKLYQFLTNISGAGNKGTSTQSTGVTKDIAIAKKQLTQDILEQDKILKQSNADWELHQKRMQAAKIATQELDIAMRQLAQANALMTRTGGFQWLTGAEGGKSAAESAKVFAEAFRNVDIALQQAAKSNAILTKSGGFQWITGMESGKSAAESARVFSQQLAMLDKAQAEALKLNASYMGLSKSLMVSPQAISSWNMQEKEMNDVLKKFQAIALMSKQVGGKELTAVMAAMRGGATSKGSLGQSINIDAQGLQGLLKYFDDLKIKAPQAFDAVNKALIPMGVNLTKTHSKVQTFIDSVKSYAGFQIKFYAGMAAIFTVTSAITHAARESVVFAQSLKDIQAVTGATDTDIQKLANSAKKLSVETPLAATEIAKLGLQLMRAGLDIETTMAAMEASAKIATISGEDLKTVADTVASVFMIWKLGADEATRAGTALAAALNYSKLDIQDFGTALNYVGGMASTMKFSLEEVAAVLSSMSNLGIRASTMATGWRQFVASMIAPSGRLSKHLSDVGANFDKLNAIKIDGPNKMATILAELSRISPITGKEILSTADAVKLLERRSGAFFLALRTTGVPYLIEMQKSMSDTRAYTEGLARVMEGPISAFKLFGDQIQLSVLNLSTVFLPVIRAVIDVLTALASAVSHSVHFFTDGAGKIITYTALLSSAIVVLRNFKVAALSALTITAWNQLIVIMNSFRAVLIGVASNVAMLGKELKNLWIIMAKNPLGLFLLAVTAIAGSSLADWLIEGQTEMEKMNQKIKAMTKSQEEMMKKGEELRKQYPDLFQAMSDSATDAGEKLDKYKASLDKALNSISKYTTPEIPADVANWIDTVLIPANEEVAKLQDQLNSLRLEMAKINEEATKVTWWDRIKEGGRRSLSILDELTFGFARAWDSIKSFFNKLVEKAMAVYKFLASVPFLKDWLEGARSMLESLSQSAKGIGGQIQTNISSFDQSILDRKTTKAKSTLAELTEANKGIVAQYEQAEAAFAEAVKAGKFDDILMKVAGSIKTLSSAELREQGLKNLASTLATIASQDPGRFKQVLGITAQAYLEWSEKIGKADARLAKREAKKAAEIVGVNYEDWKDRFALLKKLHEGEIEDLKSTLAQEAEAERNAVALQQASLEDRKWLLETFYDENLMDAQAYYDQKFQLMSEAYETERNLVITETSRQLELQMGLYQKAEEEWWDLIDARDKKFNELSEITPPNLHGFLADEEFDTLFAKAPETLQPSIKKLTDEIRNMNTQEKALLTTQEKLNDAILLVSTKAFNKLSEMTAKEVSEVMKLNHEQTIAIATQSYRHEEFRIKNQKAYNEVLLESNELAGNWNAVEEIKLQMLQADNKLSEIAIEKQIAIIQGTIKELEVLKVVLENNKMDTAYTEKQIADYKTFIPILEALLGVRKQLSEQAEKDAQLKKNNPITYAIQQVDKEWADTNKRLLDTAEKTYRELAAAFSDIFYDAFTGKLKSLKDYFESIFQSILRTFTDTMGRMAAQNISVSLGFGGGGLGGGSMLPGILGMGSLIPGIGTILGGSMLGGSAGTGMMLGGAAGMAMGMGGLGGGAALAALGGTGALGAQIATFLATSSFAIPIVGAIGAGIGLLIDSILGDETMQQKFRVVEGEVHTYGDMSNKKQQELLETLQPIYDSFVEMGEKLGLEAQNLFNIDRWGLEDQEKITSKELMNSFVKKLVKSLGMDPEDFKKFQQDGEKIYETIIRVMDAFANGIPRTIKGIDAYINAVKSSDDSIALWINQLNQADDNIQDLQESLDKAVDPSEAILYADQLKQAIYERYQYEKELIEGIVSSIRQLELQSVNFAISMAQKIDGLTGSFNSIGMIWDRMVFIAGELGSSSLSASQKLELLNEGIGWLDQWVSANIAAIQQQYEAQKAAIQQAIDNINTQIAALEKQKKAIREQQEAIDEQISALQEQVDLAKEWSGILDSVKKQILDMKTSLDSPRDVFERMDVLKSEIERVKGLYAGATGEEKAGYAAELQALIADYLSIAQEAYQRPSDAYQQIYDEMLGLLGMIQTDAETYAVSEVDLLQQIAALEAERKALDEQSKEIDEQIEQYQEQIADLNAQMALLDEQMAADIQAFKESAVQYYEWAQTTGAELYQQEIESLREKLREIIGDEDVETYLDNLQEATVLELTQIRTILEKLLEEFRNVPQSATGRVAKSPMLTWVAEAEPELIAPISAFHELINSMVNPVLSMSQPSFRPDIHGEGGRSTGDTYVMFTIPISVGEISDKAMAERVANSVADRVIAKLPRSGKGRKIIQQVAGGR